MSAIKRSPCAADPGRSRGRRFAEPPPRLRSEYQRDRDRIIHCAAFRRLEYKTQVFVNHEGDLYRNRLTHSIEVAQIARSAARALALDEDLTEAIALAHDLGHTPFGHAGQDALNACMADFGGFEHNFQSLRVVDELEQRYATFPGLNLSFEAREGILKHCSRERAGSLGELGRRFLDRAQPGLEAQLTNLADEVAYNSHDVDDGLRSGLIDVDGLSSVPLFRAQIDEVRSCYGELAPRIEVHEVVRRLIDTQVVDLVETSAEQLRLVAPRDIDEVRGAGRPLIRFSDAMRRQNLDLKQYLRRELYSHWRVHRRTVKAKRIVSELFGAFHQDPRLLPDGPRRRITELEAAGEAHAVARGIADYIAGMTDRYAIREYERAVDPSSA